MKYLITLTNGKEVKVEGESHVRAISDNDIDPNDVECIKEIKTTKDDQLELEI